MWKISILICLTSSSLSHSLSTSNLTDSLSNVFDGILTFVENINTTNNLETGTKTMNSSQLIDYHGYPVEEHSVTTLDGYILRLFRIPGNESTVLLVHGLFSSSDDYLTLGNKSLVFKLATLGYDVWLGNLRGNTYSRNHTSLSPDDSSFWDFSWHEMGIYDLPAMIDYILEITAESKLAYIGHSQGTTSGYVMLSEKPTYNEKLSCMVSLASISWMSNLTSPLVQFLATKRLELEVAFKALSLYEIFPHRAPISTITAVCSSSNILSKLCYTFLSPLYGFDYDQIDNEFIGTQLSHAPSGSSLQQILHYLQNINSKLFQKYDYGSPMNFVKYGSFEAPSYSVENITTSMAIIYGKNDWLSNFEKDVGQLIAKLPNGAEVFEVDFPLFNHMDFLWGKNADDLVYSTVIELLSKYTT